MKEEKKLVPVIPTVPFAAPMQFVPTDPQGSYTGVPEIPYEEPVQDVDDL